MKMMIQTIAVLVAVLNLTGCATPYMTDRGRDAKDIFTCSLGEGYGAKLRAGPCQVGVMGNCDYCGLRAGEFFFGGEPSHEIGDWEFGPLSYVIQPIVFACVPLFEPPHYDYYTGQDDFSLWATEIRGKTIEAKNIVCVITQDSLAHYSQVEVVGGFIWTVRLGFNPGELLDFILGWTTIDIFGDDLEGRKRKEISNRATEATR